MITTYEEPMLDKKNELILIFQKYKLSVIIIMHSVTVWAIEITELCVIFFPSSQQPHIYFNWLLEITKFADWFHSLHLSLIIVTLEKCSLLEDVSQHTFQRSLMIHWGFLFCSWHAVISQKQLFAVGNISWLKSHWIWLKEIPSFFCFIFIFIAKILN